MKHEHAQFDEEGFPVDPEAEEELRALFQRTAPQSAPTDIDSLHEQAGQQDVVTPPLHRVKTALQEIFFNRHISKPILRRRTIMIARIASCCLVVAGLVGLTGWLVMSESATSIAFADVQKKMKEARTVTFTFTLEKADPAFRAEDLQFKYWYTGDNLIRHEMIVKEKTVLGVIVNTKNGKGMMFNSIRKTACFYEDDINGNSAQKPKSNYDMILNIVKNHKNPKKLSENLIDGKKTIGFLLPGDGTDNDAQRIWVDAETQLPVLIEFLKKDESGELAVRGKIPNIVFGANLDPNLFEVTLPPGYRLESEDNVTIDDWHELEDDASKIETE